jgi:hypothetical protein
VVQLARVETCSSSQHCEGVRCAVLVCARSGAVCYCCASVAAHAYVYRDLSMFVYQCYAAVVCESADQTLLRKPIIMFTLVFRSFKASLHCMSYMLSTIAVCYVLVYYCYHCYHYCIAVNNCVHYCACCVLMRDKNVL